MSDDLIKREDAIKAIHNYWKKRLDTLPTKESEYGEVYADIQQIDKILEHNRTLCNFIKAIPSADRLIKETVGTLIHTKGDDAVSVAFRNAGRLVRNAIDGKPPEFEAIPSADRPQGEWIDAEIPLESGGSMPIQACNLCKTFYPLAYTGGGHRFCPNCGARMLKGAEAEG